MPANTTYVASLFTTFLFAVRGPSCSTLFPYTTLFRSLASGVDGSNGVYVYASAPQFPTTTYGDSNYWVNVTFTSSGSPPPLALACPAGSGTVGTAYNSSLVASGGVNPYTYSIMSGSLP